MTFGGKIFVCWICHDMNHYELDFIIKILAREKWVFHKSTIFVCLMLWEVITFTKIGRYFAEKGWNWWKFVEIHRYWSKNHGNSLRLTDSFGNSVKFSEIQWNCLKFSKIYWKSIKNESKWANIFWFWQLYAMIGKICKHSNLSWLNWQKLAEIWINPAKLAFAIFF